LVNAPFASWIIHACIIKERAEYVKKKMNLFLIKKKTGENDLIWLVIVIGYYGYCRNPPTLDPVDPKLFRPNERRWQGSRDLGPG
jgi:hypothetical protein